MHSKGTYQKMLATSFLLLYVFIYMPVQLWHQHDPIVKKPVSTQFAKAVVDSHNEDCSICQHTYTAYINDNSLFEVCENELVILNKPVLFIHFTSALIDKASNKGPPAA